jgi:lipid-A-disaccharide synthase
VRDVLVVAGEASGDLHGAGFVQALRARVAGVSVTAVGGTHMRSAGVTLIDDTDAMSVMGFVEVLRLIPHHWRLLRTIERRFARGQVGLVVLIDYPGFNLKVAKAARRHGVPVLYYITPQVWAWGAKRLELLRVLVRKAAVILPFEEALLRAHGIDATFVGHPLLDRALELPSRQAAREQLRLSADGQVLALFPGSRPQEVKRHLAPFVVAAQLLRRERPALQVLIAGAPTVRIDRASCPFPVIEDDAFRVLRAADVALCKSGTTTLQAAVAGCPLAVAYATNPWTYAIARRVVTIPHIGLVNVVAGKQVAREFVQHELEPVRVAAHLGELLDDHQGIRGRQLAELRAVRDQLGTAGASGRVAAIAAGLLE